MKTPNIEEVITDYLACALWATNDNRKGHFDDNLDKNFSIHDISPEAKNQAIKDCERFLNLTADFALDEAVGHDFFLNRNGHGSGFWDNLSYSKETGKRLSDIAHSFKEIDFYVGDDNLIYSA